MPEQRTSERATGSLSPTIDRSGVGDAVVPEIVTRAHEAIAALGPSGLVNARWAGLARTGLASVSLVDAFRLGDAGGVAIVQAHRVDGVTTLLTLPLEVDATWIGLLELATRGGSVEGALGGRLDGHPARAAAQWPGEGMRSSEAAPRARHAPGDQSHTSVIVDEAQILKLYRRLTGGANPEVELLSSLPSTGPVPDWYGSVELTLPGGQQTSIAIAQAFIADAADAFETLADALAAWLASGGDAVPTDMLRDAGVATGRLHDLLGSSSNPAFVRRAATSADRDEWLRAALATLDAAVLAVANVDRNETGRLERARLSIERGITALATETSPEDLHRIHGDLHLGQLLPIPDGVLIIDFEGDPTRSPAERASVASPLRDVAGMLRSIDHVARSGLRRAVAAQSSWGETGTGSTGSDLPGRDATADALEAWIHAARTAFIEGYAVGLRNPTWRPNAALLRAMEFDKELAEYVYAATFLPAWLYAPMGGMRGLLGAGTASEAFA